MVSEFIRSSSQKEKFIASLLRDYYGREVKELVIHLKSISYREKGARLSTNWGGIQTTLFTEFALIEGTRAKFNNEQPPQQQPRTTVLPSSTNEVVAPLGSHTRIGNSRKPCARMYMSL